MCLDNKVSAILASEIYQTKISLLKEARAQIAQNERSKERRERGKQRVIGSSMKKIEKSIALVPSRSGLPTATRGLLRNISPRISGDQLDKRRVQSLNKLSLKYSGTPTREECPMERRLGSVTCALNE
jgi:hypothetical protein